MSIHPFRDEMSAEGRAVADVTCSILGHCLEWSLVYCYCNRCWKAVARTAHAAPYGYEVIDEVDA